MHPRTAKSCAALGMATLSGAAKMPTDARTCGASMSLDARIEQFLNADE